MCLSGSVVVNCSGLAPVRSVWRWAAHCWYSVHNNDPINFPDNASWWCDSGDLCLRTQTVAPNAQKNYKCLAVTSFLAFCLHQLLLNQKGTLAGAGMLHLRELRVLCLIVLFRATERLWENWHITKTAFPSPQCKMSCVGLALRGHVAPGRGGRVKTN